MQPCPGYAGHRFPAEIISYTVWLYFRFPLSLRHVDEILAARGVVVSHVRWSLSVGQFGGWVKLGSGCCQAASLSSPVAPYASSGVCPASVEWGRRAL
jgi:hypothetical protein